ncbi:PilZ domain-containing protein [uncultured Sphingomonas sp.]|uniref:PilZ domain-containing protein n=1 Tax=uncultured Sphingomonas sp. TaxID=158754 RepID=UPI0035CBAB8E
MDRDTGDSEPATGGGVRARKRDSLFMSARLHVAGQEGEHEVRVRNLSEGGLMVELDRAVEPGAAVTLEMRGLGEMTGVVAWRTHGRMGIALDHPIDPARARKPIAAAAATVSARPETKPAPRRR